MIDVEVIKSEILGGLLQVDSSFSFVDFYADFDKETRKLTVSFTARNNNGETVSNVLNYS